MYHQVKKAYHYSRTHPYYLYRLFKIQFLEKPFVRKSPRGPYLARVLLMLTPDCNLDCEMCNAPRAHAHLLADALKRWRRNALTIAEYEELLTDLQSFKADITLTGGEPLIHKKWGDIARAAKERKLKVEVQTNGMFLDRYLKELLAYVDVLNVSIDGPEAIHDQVRGRKGAFKKVLENCLLLEKAKKKAGQVLPYIQIVPTITESNYRFLLHTVEAVHAYLPEAFIGIQHLLFVTPAALDRYLQELPDKEHREVAFWEPALALPSFDTSVLVREIRAIREKYSSFTTFVPDLSEAEVKQWYDCPESFLQRYQAGCLSPWFELDVCPDGDVRICIDYSLGNVREKPLSSIFNNMKAQYLRHTIATRGPFSICRACCNLYKY